jgi:hypothetical protein
VLVEPVDDVFVVPIEEAALFVDTDLSGCVTISTFRAPSRQRVSLWGETLVWVWVVDVV